MGLFVLAVEAGIISLIVDILYAKKELFLFFLAAAVLYTLF